MKVNELTVERLPWGYIEMPEEDLLFPADADERLYYGNAEIAEDELIVPRTESPAINEDPDQEEDLEVLDDEDLSDT